MTFYLKYRPQTIEDIDNMSVRESITNIVESGQIPHAFLFSGPKGTGKTSTARILAKVINCEAKKKPCNKCEQCKLVSSSSSIDVIEMDAASNRGIDDIRALRDVVKLAPSKAKAKIYIIDEAHMLTTEASNALLKTLEEPPSHVYFFLATTNPEKLIDTIKSRTLHIAFTKATEDEIKRSLKRIIKAEKIKIGDEEIGKIIKLAKGSFRDAVKNLEQFTRDKSFLKNNKSFNCENLVGFALQKDWANAKKEIDKAVGLSVPIASITEDVLSFLQEKLGDSKDINIAYLIEYILKVQDYAKATPIEELPLQLAIFKWCNG